jgi:hypothetical protein
MINLHARETGVAEKARAFSVQSHLATMLFAQLTHAIGLNDVCDRLRLKVRIHAVDSTVMQLVAAPAWTGRCTTAARLRLIARPFIVDIICIASSLFHLANAQCDVTALSR